MVESRAAIVLKAPLNFLLLRDKDASVMWSNQAVKDESRENREDSKSSMVVFPFLSLLQAYDTYNKIMSLWPSVEE